MIDLTTPIIPYVGTGIFKLDASYGEVKTLLAEQNISYTEEISQPNDIDPPWYIIGIPKAGEEFDAISITFAKNRLFRICLYEDFDGKLPNGIHTGMPLDEAQRIKLCRITIFIPALERDDFFDYKW